MRRWTGPAYPSSRYGRSWPGMLPAASYGGVSAARRLGGLMMACVAVVEDEPAVLDLVHDVLWSPCPPHESLSGVPNNLGCSTRCSPNPLTSTSCLPWSVSTLTRRKCARWETPFPIAQQRLPTLRKMSRLRSPNRRHPLLATFWPGGVALLGRGPKDHRRTAGAMPVALHRLPARRPHRVQRLTSCVCSSHCVLRFSSVHPPRASPRARRD